MYTRLLIHLCPPGTETGGLAEDKLDCNGFTI